MDDDFGVATFQSTHSVLKGEQVLKEAGLTGVRLVPVPSEISSDCGVAVRFAAADIEAARDLLSGMEDLESIFRRTGGEWIPVYPAPA